MFRNRIGLLLLSGMATLCGTTVAHAQSAASMTTAGTQINNSASVSYTVNGTAQTTTSTTASFVVDRKVNFSVVTDQTGGTAVNVGQSAAVTRFKVTNTTNGTQDFQLAAAQSGFVGGLLGMVTGTDDFDLTNLKVYVDSNGNGVYDPGVDTATFIDELAPDASVAVFVVGDVPASGTLNQANVALHVTAAAGGAAGVQGAALVATDLSPGNADTVVDVVFADDDDDGPGPDLARNGQGWAYASYVVGTRNVALTVTKTALVLSDPLGDPSPKTLPGSVVQYCLLTNNATLTTAASGVTITDVVPANTVYVAGSLAIGPPGGTCTLLPTIASPYGGGYDTPSNTVTASLGTVAGGASVAVSFRVTIR